MPKYVFVHNRRMSFAEDGKTDSIEYMHAVWQKGYRSKFTQQLMEKYYTTKEAYEVAIFAEEETGLPHEAREINEGWWNYERVCGM